MPPSRSAPDCSKGWRGRIAFQALRGALPGGGELRPVSGVGQERRPVARPSRRSTARSAAARRSPTSTPGKTGNGIALNARVQLGGVEARALRYRGLADAGRPRVDADDAGQPGPQRVGADGRAVRKRHGDAGIRRVAGLDPRAFEIAIRASDDGQATDDVKLRQIVEPALSAGALSVASAQIPFTIRDGRIRIGATPLDAHGVRAIVSGGYDIPADQADIRAASPDDGAAQRPAGRRFNCSPWARQTRSTAPSMSRRCRHGWRCARSTTKPGGSMRSSAASRRHRRRRRCHCRLKRNRNHRPCRRSRPPQRTAVTSAASGPRPAPVVAKGQSRGPAPAGCAARRQRTRFHPESERPRSPCAGCQSAGYAVAAADRRQTGARFGQAKTAATGAAGAHAAGCRARAIDLLRRLKSDLALHADRLQESPVVADRDQGAVEARQRGFQHFD